MSTWVVRGHGDLPQADPVLFGLSVRFSRHDTDCWSAWQEETWKSHGSGARGAGRCGTQPQAILEAADELFATSDSPGGCRWTTSPAPPE